jgi:hypothetical protein
MLSYRYMFMDMRGNRDGTSNRSTREILSRYMVAPRKMRMAMHMLGAMYAPTDDLTLMAMVPYVRLDMDHINRMGLKFTTSSEGIGDVGLTALYVLRRQGRHRLHANVGLSLPTGSVSERDDTPMGRQRLPYPMQTGSGTYDFLPGLTYLGQAQDLSWGAQTIATLRLGNNRHSYKLGNRLSVTAWLSRPWTQSLSTSVRLAGQVWGNIHGSDSALNPNLVPTADPDRRAGRRIDLAFGVNWYFRKGLLAGHRLAIEYLVPIYQWLDGPQLETDWSVVVGWQRAF